MGTQRAIKIMRDPGDENARKRFLREARLAAQIHQPDTQPNLVEVLDFGRLRNDHLYLSMPFIEGPTLAEIIRESAPMDCSRALALTQGLAAGLNRLHANGIIHRDLKPSNVILSAGEKPVLLDLGIATYLSGENNITATDARVGTPKYMAPEQLEGDTAPSPAADQYALAAITFELLTGTAGDQNSRSTNDSPTWNKDWEEPTTAVFMRPWKELY